MNERNRQKTYHLHYKKRFNDRNADDMQSGDMDADILKKHYHLGQVSTSSTGLLCPPTQHPATNTIQPVSREKAIAMLYDELRSQSYAFSFRGPYQGLIINLFNHMQRSNGNDFQHPFMDNAYRNLILSDNSIDSTLSIIKNTIEQFDFNKSQLTKEHFSNVLSKKSFTKIHKMERFRQWNGHYRP